MKRLACVVLALTSACAPMWSTSGSFRYTDRSESVEPGPIVLDAQRHGDHVEVYAFQERNCVTTRTRESRSVRKAEPWGGWALTVATYVLGGCLLLPGGAMFGIYLGQDESSADAETMPLYGPLLFLAGGGLLVGVAGGNHWRARVPAQVDVQREPVVKRKRCNGGAAGLHVVARAPDGQVVAEGQTGDDGRVSLTSSKKAWLKRALSIEADGAEPVTVTPE